MKYTEYQPSKHLSQYVKCFWTLKKEPEDKVRGFEISPIADGCPGLIFQLSEDQQLVDGQKDALPKAFIYGQMVKRRKMELLGQFNTIGIYFYPSSLKAIFGMDANILTDDCVDFDLVTPKEYEFLHEQLASTDSTEHQIGLLSNYFLAQAQKHQYSNQTVGQAIREIQNSKGALSYKYLLEELKISERSLERHFKQHVGITPKMYMRICRFQASLLQLKQKGYQRLSDIAYDNGYADQSHFIREFKEFLGFSPLQMNKKPDQLILDLSEMMK